MMGEGSISSLISDAKKSAFTSLAYVDEKDVGKPEYILKDMNYLFFYSIEKERVQIYWSAETDKAFLLGLDKVLRHLASTGNRQDLDIEFIPPALVAEMEKRGFMITCEWQDFFLEDLQSREFPETHALSIRRIRDDEYDLTSAVTLACAGQSRGYTGETAEWMKIWNEKENSAVFAAYKDNRIIGTCAVSLYGFEKPNGPVLWIREIAIHPHYQGKGYGFDLLSFCLDWGRSKGARRSFLACDTDNRQGIRLYEGLGFKSNNPRGQINMSLHPNRKE